MVVVVALPPAKVVVVVVALDKVTVEENALELLPNWNVIVPDEVAVTVHDRLVEDSEAICTFADVWSPEQLPTLPQLRA
jgi:hypothetical protein